MLLANGNLHVHDVTSGAVAIHALPGVDGANTNYWTTFLPRNHDEAWVFGGKRTLRRYALPRR